MTGVDFPLKGVVSCTKRLKCLNSGECVGSSYIWMSSNRDITDFVRIKVEQRDVWSLLVIGVSLLKRTLIASISALFLGLLMMMMMMMMMMYL